MNELTRSSGLAAKQAFLLLSVEERGHILREQAQEAQADYLECEQEREEWQGCRADDLESAR